MFKFLKMIFVTPIVRLFYSQPKVRHSADEPSKPIDQHDRGALSKAKYALIPGHNNRSPGAYSFKFKDPITGKLKQISEHVFWTERMIHVQRKLKEYGIYAPMIERPERGGYSHECSSVTNEVKKAGILYTFHGHFNAAASKARGCEVLIPRTATIEDNLIADYFTDLLNKELGFKERGNDGVVEVPENHRGSKMLYMLKEYAKTRASLILEPAFGHWDNPESRILFVEPERIEDLLVRTIVAIERKQIRDLDA